MSEAFKVVMEEVTTPPVLQFLNFSLPIIVETYESPELVGTFIVRKYEYLKVHRIQFSIQSMKEVELMYAVCERVALAFILELKSLKYI